MEVAGAKYLMQTISRIHVSVLGMLRVIREQSPKRRARVRMEVSFTAHSARPWSDEINGNHGYSN
jgi:hypothetical protein